MIVFRILANLIRINRPLNFFGIRGILGTSTRLPLDFRCIGILYWLVILERVL